MAEHLDRWSARCVRRMRRADVRTGTDRNPAARAALLERIGWRVRNALLGEVYATPKPGLVDRRDTGAHRDMNYETFLASTEAITPYMVRMFAEGMDATAAGHTPEEVFRMIRGTGLEAEQAMYAATDGVNTHKGMIFTMGIVLAAAGILYARADTTSEQLVEKELQPSDDVTPEALASADVQPMDAAGESVMPSSTIIAGQITVDAILDMARQMTARSMAEDFRKMLEHPPKTHGERLFQTYGERGIRGQAMEGFPILRDTAVPWLRRFRNLSSDEALQQAFAAHATLRRGLLQDTGSMHAEHFENAVHVSTLIAIMSVLNDTNVFIRSSYEDMCWLQAESSTILGMGAMFTEEGVRAIEALNMACIEKNISPGGAADILAVAILLLKLTEDVSAGSAAC